MSSPAESRALSLRRRTEFDRMMQGLARDRLLRHGMSQARSLTTDWEERDRVVFLADVQELLEEKVQPDWTEEWVQHLVTREFGEWEDVDDADEEGPKEEGEEENGWF